jgi:hypothetical protein
MGGFIKAWKIRAERLKVIHTPKNLFCYVVSICNLVQEFNGLVSIKGPTQVGPFTLSKSAAKFAFILSAFFIFCIKNLTHHFNTTFIE